MRPSFPFRSAALFAGLGLFAGASALAQSPAAPTTPPTTSAPGPSAAPASDPDAALVESVCITCHGMTVVAAKGRTPQDWADVMSRMKDYGADAPDSDMARIQAYLIRTYPAAADAGAAPAAPAGPAAPPAQ